MHFSYVVFADGRRVPSWVSTDTTGAAAELGFFATIWSTEVLGFRRWRCDVSMGDRMGGLVPPTGMTMADVDAFRRDGCARRVIAACRGEDWGQFDFDNGPNVPLSEDIPALELMAQGGGFGCGGGLRGWVGEAMHGMEHWALLRAQHRLLRARRGVQQPFTRGLRHRLQRRIARADRSLCPACEYPLQPGSRCPECGIDAAAEVQRCQMVLAGPVVLKAGGIG